MRKILLLTSAAICCMAMEAGTIKGIVVGDDDKPVAYAYVSVEGKKYATQTDKNGYFRLEVPSGTYKLNISSMGYEKKQVDIEAGNNNVKVCLREDLIHLNQVTVTGTRTPKTLASTPVVTRVITAEDIKKIDATNIKDVLVAEIPGVEFSYSMNQQVSMRLQGLGGMSVLFLIDGDRLAGETLDNTDFQRLNMDNIERIEIVKGAASALYGSNSVGAVVNIITKSESEPWAVQLGTHWGNRYGEQRHGVTASFRQGRLTNILNVQNDKTDSYRVYEKDNADSTLVYGSRQWNFKDKLVYRINGKSHLIGKAGYYFHERNSSDIQKDRSRDFSGGLRYVGQLTDDDALDIGYTGDRYDKSDFYPATKKDLLDYKNTQHSLRALYTHTFGKELAMTLGGDGMADYLKSYQFAGGGSHKQYTADVFAQADWNIGGHWNIVGGLRADYFSKYGWELTPKVAAMYRTGAWRFRGSYSKGFRAPTLKELYMDFNMANIFNIYGNENLKSEKTNSFSVSAEYSKRYYSLTVTGYYHILDNEISTIWDQALDNGRGAMHYQNVEGTNLASIDAMLMARYPCGIGAKLSYAYFHEFTRNGAPNTADTRPHTLTWQVDYRKAFRNYELNVVVNGRYLSKADFHTISYGAFDTYLAMSSPAYQMWKLTLLQRFFNAFNVTMSVDNLFNYKPKQYQYNSPYTVGTVFTMGASVELGQLVRLF